MLYLPLPIGKACSACGQWTPYAELTRNRVCSYGVQALCKECARRRTREWNKKNKERKRATTREWEQRNPDKLQAIRERSKEKSRQRAHRWYATNKDRAKQSAQQFRKDHPDLMRQRARDRKYKRKNVPGSYTAAELRQQYERQHGKCYYCGKHVGDDWQPDHVIPVTRPGGTNYISNIVIACTACNQRKRDRLPHEWPEGGRLL